MTRTMCFDADAGKMVGDFIDELLEARGRCITPFYGIFNDQLIIVKDSSTKDILLDKYMRGMK